MKDREALQLIHNCPLSLQMLHTLSCNLCTSCPSLWTYKSIRWAETLRMWLRNKSHVHWLPFSFPLEKGPRRSSHKSTQEVNLQGLPLGNHRSEIPPKPKDFQQLLAANADKKKNGSDETNMLANEYQMTASHLNAWSWAQLFFSKIDIHSFGLAVRGWHVVVVKSWTAWTARYSFV